MHICDCGRLVENSECDCGYAGHIELGGEVWLEKEVYVDGVRLEPSPDSTRISLEVDIPAHYSEETLEQTRKAIEILAEYARLFAAKQESYGRGNIDGFGELGVLIRLNDKVERLKNLLYRNKSNDLESIEDTWLDVIGYGLIGLMIHRRRW